MKPRAESAARRRQAGKASARLTEIWTLPAHGMRLYEKFALGAMIGVLAAQSKEPSPQWVRRVSYRIGCDMAEEAVRLRRKQPR